MWCRCRWMDCHESRSHMKLVGEFIKTDGMYDFTEQVRRAAVCYACCRFLSAGRHPPPIIHLL